MECSTITTAGGPAPQRVGRRQTGRSGTIGHALSSAVTRALWTGLSCLRSRPAPLLELLELSSQHVQIVENGFSKGKCIRGILATNGRSCVMRSLVSEYTQAVNPFHQSTVKKTLRRHLLQCSLQWTLTYLMLCTYAFQGSANHDYGSRISLCAATVSCLS
jgi:hypothetical protein